VVIFQKQLHQTVVHAHDCHHDEPSLPMIGLMFMVFIDEWLRVLLGFFAQPLLLHFDVVHWLFPFVLHPWLVHSQVCSP
jgi:hypothetical protein